MSKDFGECHEINGEYRTMKMIPSDFHNGMRYLVYHIRYKVCRTQGFLLEKATDNNS